ncbi:YraN family protein [Pseudohalocynthiibacter aestuariivivens]|jgi:putative endonuclease|uniref:UPF0102 protein ACFFUT_01690 n=1 Tax=Pseudohalocynthiibacter aestuariivivens TaxID=1591409 RepID=A0ABV5JAL5_9RHOB|nr:MULTISPECIES: YraN family protein [Pseudohalocynthiibacter]MBS9715947.1 YraN family protein [Pseudohalocynthiibacter aestuariivivens]MCK0102497.1 YraN family protein [Pseudohalocynthiibacter sp. F2068]
MSGRTSYLAGLSAEEIVARHYLAEGCEIRAMRWRGTGGEIDLIVQDGAHLIFVEVKKSRDFARAAERIRPNQMQRIYATASEFLAGEPAGQNTDARFDVALVDASGSLQIIENAFGH